MGRKLTSEFFERTDVILIAKELLGKVLVTDFGGKRTAGIIVETEAYAGLADKASHAYNGRRTPRTEIMYAAGGTAYIYLCYGIHHLFNVVTNVENIPHAVLIRALQPVEGVEEMMRRRNKTKMDYTLTKGPGSLSQAMGLNTIHTGRNLLTDTHVWLEDEALSDTDEIISSPRIGVDYAGEDALLNYRFYLKGNPYVSGKKTG